MLFAASTVRMRRPTPAVATRAPNWSTRADLPIPASPTTKATPPWQALSAERSRTSMINSRRRPTKSTPTPILSACVGCPSPPEAPATAKPAGHGQVFASGSTVITSPAEEFQCALEEERRGRRIVFRGQR